MSVSHSRGRHRHPRKDRRKNVGVSFSLPQANFRKLCVERVGEDPREDIRVSVGVVECQLKRALPETLSVVPTSSDTKPATRQCEIINDQMTTKNTVSFQVPA